MLEDYNMELKSQSYPAKGEGTCNMLPFARSQVEHLSIENSKEIHDT